jgi:hypothetical protein
MADTLCRTDQRRRVVRNQKDAQGVRTPGGLDYVEISDDQLTITAYFLGKLPAGVCQDPDTLAPHVRLTGGRRVRDVKIVKVEVFCADDPEVDDHIVVYVDKPGDFSTYTLSLVDLDGVDSRYSQINFTFKINCPNDLDCVAVAPPSTGEAVHPEIDYLAKDYASFRQLILDRLSISMPGWTERHAPDLGIALVEVMAYAADTLSYYQDAVATEAYLGTARRRISVRRHARLVDYLMHEGCNARTWVSVETDTDLPELAPEDFYFLTEGSRGRLSSKAILDSTQLGGLDLTGVSCFEPLAPATDADGKPARLNFRAAHSEILFYTWGETECYLPAGATSATLLDRWVYTGEVPNPAQQSAQAYAAADKGQPSGPPPLDPNKIERALKLRPGDVLIIEEVAGPGSGLEVDKDPTHRRAVRLVKVEPGEDPAYDQPLKVGDYTYPRKTPVVGVTWAAADALPSDYYISVIGSAPECRYVEPISVVRGNILLVDHGCTQGREDLGAVPVRTSQVVCECPGIPGDVEFTPGRYSPHLGKASLTHSEPLPQELPPAGRMLKQDPRAALPQLWLASAPPTPGLAEPLFTAADLADPLPLISRMAGGTQPAARYLAAWLPADLRKELDQLGKDRTAAAKLEEQRQEAAKHRDDKADGQVGSIGDLDKPVPMPQPSDRLVAGVRKELQDLLWNWTPRYDLLDSGGDKLHFVVEVDDDGVAHLRFGDGQLGRQPGAGSGFMATYRVGNGAAGNIGAEAISYLVLRKKALSGVSLTVRNPLPATGGVDPEPVAQPKLMAPGAFRTTLRRAITAGDYAALAELNPKVQRAAATLTWTGSWYEADVAVDPYDSEEPLPELYKEVTDALGACRRAGHLLRVGPPNYASLDVELEVCIKPDYQRGHVKAALLDAFSNRKLPGGGLGFFHPDRLTFGSGIYVSQLVATAIAVPGVLNAQVTRLQRQYEAPDDELDNGVLPLGPLEIARLDNDPDYPENGVLKLTLQGGR